MRADAMRNRERLMAAAAQMFAQRGIDVALEEIARSAGVSIGTLYNHFPNRGALLDAVLPERLAELDRLAQAAIADPDPWNGFAGFLDALCMILAQDRSMTEAIARNPGGPSDVDADCGRGGEVLKNVVEQAQHKGALRPDFGVEDMTTLVSAMSNVINMSNGDATRWRRHLGFVLDGLRPRTLDPLP